MSCDRIGIPGRAARARTGRQLSWLAAVAIVLPLAVTPARSAGMWSDWDQPQPAPAPPPPVVRKRLLVPRVATAPKTSRHGAKTVINVPQEGAKPHGPLLIAVSINKQHVRIYDAEGLFAESPVSTGMRGHATPMGVFSIIQKSKYHRSNIYSGAPMPYMQRITWSGVALHAGVLPGYPASHGCIRMPMAFAVKMWGWTRMGARVIVAPDDITPAAFAHPLLALRQPATQQPAAAPPATAPEAKDAAPAKSEPAKTEPAGSTENTPPATPDRAQNAEPASPDTLRPSITERVQVADANADATPTPGNDRTAATDVPAPAAPKLPVAEASDTTAAAGAAKAADASGPAPAQPALADATPAAIAAPAPIMKGLPAPPKDKPAAAAAPKDAPAGADATAAAAPKRVGHVAVLISRKDARLYVRQNFEPWFDAPISVSQSDRPLGTHIFTAEADAGGKDGYRWSVVTLPQLPKRVDVAETRAHGKRTLVTEEIQPPPAPEPKDALDRLTLPADVIAKIASALAPGGSIIVSDRGPGDETGLGTDFILPLR